MAYTRRKDSLYLIETLEHAFEREMPVAGHCQRNDFAVVLSGGDVTAAL